MLQRYILRELLPPLLTGTALFVAIISFGYFFVSSQFLGGAPVFGVLRYIALQVPDTLVKVFPMAVVLMVVVAYGRLSNERELSAAQSGGVSLGRAAWPALGIALAVSGLSLYLSEAVVPQANVAARAYYWDDLTGAGLSQLAGRTVEIGPGLELHFARYDPGTREMHNVRLQQWSEEGAGRAALLFLADRGTYEGSAITLSGYQGYSIDYAAVSALDELPGNASGRQYQGALKQVFKLAYLPSKPADQFEIDTGLSRQQTLAQFADAISADNKSLSQLWQLIFSPASTPSDRFAARVELQRKLALPFGNLVLVLAALPFALRYGRTTGVALGVALIIAISYYVVYIVGLSLTNSGVLPPELGAWLANVVFALTGLYLLRRAG